MFCEKCGKPTEGEQFVCAECAAQPVEVVFDEAPVPAETVVPEAAVETPVQPEETAPEAVCDDTFTLGSTDVALEQIVPKKKKKKGLVLGIIAGVLVALGVVAALFWSTVWAFLCRTFMSPEDYLVKVETKALGEYTESISQAYGKWLASFSTSEPVTAGKTTVNITANDQILAIAEAYLQQRDIDMDLSWLNSLSLSSDINMQDNAYQLIYTLALGQTDVLSIDAIFDFDNNAFYMALPEINDEYIYLPMPEGADYSSLQNYANASLAASQVLAEQLPNEEDVNKMLNKFVEIALAEIKNVSKSTKTVRVGKVSQSMTVLTSKITAKDLMKIAEEILKECEDDETLKQILDAYSAYATALAESSGVETEDFDLYANFIESLPAALESLEERQENADKNNYLKLYTYVDMQGNVRGHELAVYTDGEKSQQEIYVLTAQKGDTTYIEAKIAALEIEGEKLVDGDVTSGSLDISANGEHGFTLEYESAADNTFTFRIRPSEAFIDGLLTQLDIPAALLGSNLALEVICGREGQPNSFALNILMNDEILIGLDFSVETYSGDEISIPSNYLDAESEKDMLRWYHGSNFNRVFDALEEIGVPDEIIDKLTESVQPESFLELS